MRAIHQKRPRKEWRSTSDQPIPKDYFAWLDSDWLQSFLYMLLICVLGFFAQNIAVGLVLTGMYAVASLVLRIPSSATFKVALFGLIVLPILTFTDRQDLVGIYAQYVFLLLCIGTVTALREAWRSDSSFEVGLPSYAKVEASGRSAI
jgi:hypothetical protein